MEMIFDIHFRQLSISTANPRLGIIGPSGCGKSTLIRFLAGLEHQEGRFTFNQQSMMDLPSWKRSFGYLPQDILLMPHLNVRDNITFPKNSELNLSVLEHLGIDHLTERMPRNLSGGEKQRVGLARALSSAPTLLLLDEPFSSLDRRTKSQVIAFLNTLTTPMVVVSHDVGDLKALNTHIASLES